MIFIVFLCITLVIIVLTSFGIFKYKIDRMTPVPTCQIKDSVYAVKDGTYANMFLIKGNDGFLAIDCGENSTNVQKEINSLGIKTSEIKAVFLTHTDRDHIGALELFPQAKIYISKEEEKMIDGSTVRSFLFMKNKLRYPYETIEDRETIEVLGIEIKGILTKGHTLGSMCFLINNKHLFTGDVISIKNGKITDENEFFHMDKKENKEAIKKLAFLEGVEGIFTSHYGYTDDFQKVFEKGVY